MSYIVTRCSHMTSSQSDSTYAGEQRKATQLRPGRKSICPLSFSWGGGAENSIPGLARWWMVWLYRVMESTEISSNMQLVCIRIWGGRCGKGSRSHKCSSISQLPTFLWTHIHEGFEQISQSADCIVQRTNGHPDGKLAIPIVTQQAYKQLKFKIIGIALFAWLNWVQTLLGTSNKSLMNSSAHGWWGVRKNTWHTKREQLRNLIRNLLRSIPRLIQLPPYSLFSM